MEKRALIAISIAFAILMLWQFIFPPQKQVPPKQIPSTQSVEVKKEEPQQEAVAKPIEEVAHETQETAAVPGTFQAVKDAEEKEIILETALSLIRFSNKGGVVTSWRLKHYLGDDGKPLELVAPESKIFSVYPLDIKTGDEKRDAKIRSSLFMISAEKDIVKGANGKELKGQVVRLKFADEEGLLIEKKLEFPDESYIGNLEFSASEKGQQIPTSIVWGSNFGVGGDGANRFYYSGQCTANIAGKLLRVQKKSVQDTKTFPGEIIWAGIEDQYFGSIFIPLSPVTQMNVFPSKRTGTEGKEEKYLNISLPDTDKGYKLFVGPKDYQLLTAAGSNLNQVVNFGSFWLIAIIAKGLFISLVWLYNHTIANYGFGIIVITLIIRVIFFPLTQKSFVSMKKMQTQMKKIQPKINAIKERHHKKKTDYQARQKMNQEIMELYKKEGINPLGGMSGCLPLLIQLPILWGFYNVLTVAIELRKAPFLLWINDLSVKDPYYITPLLMGATMLIQQKMSGPTGGDPFQQKMMMFMPLFFTFFFLSFPSGLVLYWLVNNILGIGQQYLINKEAEKLILAEKK